MMLVSMNCLEIPKDAGVVLRNRMGLADHDPLRISYITGPGDVVGTYAHWRAGKHDPRVPIIAYSTMFFELVKYLGAEGQLLCNVDPPDIPAAPFTFVKLPVPDPSGRIRYRLSQARRVRAAIKAIDCFKPHIVVASSDFPITAWPELARRGLLVPSLHNTFWPMGRTPASLRERLKLWQFRRAARPVLSAVCISEECARQLTHLTKGKTRHDIACPQILESYDEPLRNTARRLLFVGRIEANKGIFLLLDAVVDLISDRPDMSLTFAGFGSADTELKTRIEKLALPQIKFVGRLSSEGIHTTLSNSDLLVCPTMTSFNEGLAVVGFEAAAHGVPSILSSVVPAKELLRRASVVFPADDGNALKECLTRLLDEETAYAELVSGALDAKKLIYDRSRSWGSKLYSAMCNATDGASS